ncbi:hypothetical protein M3Y98_00254300 [Aphelenchoides besseyi]|nr:hypothetical protein M3Y98_00254300 [Aphelenchoides besseyi]KAI6200800.1 hypothetical protein M3Y96_00772800 [Aphelenchoides besseyi]
MLRLSPSIRRLVALRSQHGLNQPSETTGIEHANKFQQTGRQHQKDPKEYKCAEYLNFNVYSYYDTEVAMNSHRVPQPSNKAADLEPKFK